eukprot:1152471-Pelagomonas_calceolata.AAC.1
MVEGMGSADGTTHVQENCVESGLSTLKLFAQITITCCCKDSSWFPGLLLDCQPRTASPVEVWCAASFLFVTSHIAEYPM